MSPNTINFVDAKAFANFIATETSIPFAEAVAECFKKYLALDVSSIMRIFSRGKYRYSMRTAKILANRYARLYMSNARINQKYFNGLMAIAKKEGIPVHLVEDSLDEMNSKYNTINPPKSLDKLAVGLYKYQGVSAIGEDGKQRLVEFIKPVSIYVHAKGRSIINIASILAHELGHHFSIKNSLDTSEKSANAYTLILAKEILDEKEFRIIEGMLRIDSGERFYYKKNKPEDGRIYYNVANIVNDSIAIKRDLRAYAYRHYKSIEKK